MKKMRLPDDLIHKLIDLTEELTGTTHKITLILKDGKTLSGIDVFNATLISLPNHVELNPSDLVDVKLESKK